MPDNKHVAIVTALKEELAAIEAAIPAGARPNLTLVRGGVGWTSAAKAVAQLLASPHPPGLICSSGFCGGLADGLEVGQIVVASMLRADAGMADHKTAAIPDAEALRQALELAGLGCRVGALVSTRAAVTSAEQKRALGAGRQALAVDMESFPLCEAAAAAGIAVLAVRVVSDSVLDELPPEVGGFLDENGSVRVAHVARYAMGGPRNMKTLWELKARTDKAAASLGAAWKVLWPLISRL